MDPVDDSWGCECCLSISSSNSKKVHALSAVQTTNKIVILYYQMQTARAATDL